MKQFLSLEIIHKNENVQLGAHCTVHTNENFFSFKTGICYTEIKARSQRLEDERQEKRL